MAQAVELLHSKLEVLSSNYSLIKKKKKTIVSVWNLDIPLAKMRHPSAFLLGAVESQGFHCHPQVMRLSSQ
jgi:hypothetical protein